MVNRKLFLYHSTPLLLLLLHFFLHKHYILSSLLSLLLLLPTSNSTLLYNYHTIYYTTVPYSENPTPGSFKFLFLYSYILYILQKKLPSAILSIITAPLGGNSLTL